MSLKDKGTLAWGVALLLLSASCAAPPPLRPLTERVLEANERRWEAHGSASYHLVVRVKPPRVNAVVYDVVVAGGEIAEIERDGQAVSPDTTDDYSMSGLFRLLREDLRLVDGNGNTPAIDIRARFESETGRIESYRRAVGTTRRRVLQIEVLEYEPVAGREVRGVAR